MHTSPKMDLILVRASKRAQAEGRGQANTDDVLIEMLLHEKNNARTILEKFGIKTWEVITYANECRELSRKQLDLAAKKP